MPLKRLRVLFVIDSAAIGGAEAVVHMLLRGLSARGVACYVACPDAGPMLARYRQCAAGIATFPRRLWHPRAILQLAGCVRRWQIDVVHTFLYSSDVAGILAARMSHQARVVVHVVGHNFLVTEERGIRRLRKRCLSWCYRLIYRWADEVIAVSQAVKDDLVLRRGIKVPSSRIIVIPHSIWEPDLGCSNEDVARARQHFAIHQDAVLCVTMGSLIPIKGHQYLLHGLQRLVRSTPALACMMIGDGPQRPMLEHEAARLGLNGRVIFVGQLEGALRNAVLRLSRLVVLPSLSEGLPVTIVEAMALAKPIVTTDVGGNREVVEDGVNGLLVPPRDPEALASAVHRLAADEAFAVRLGQAGRRRFEERFSLRQMLQQLETVYAGGLG